MADDAPHQQTPVPVPYVAGQPVGDASASDSGLAASAGAEQAPATRTGTPTASSQRSGNGPEAGPGPAPSSRAASQMPGDGGGALPAAAAPHGAPVRQYLNARVVGPLLEGMKQVAREQPKDPLRVLGEYLLQRSKELESSASSSASAA
ncbi:hypothetical protein GGS23DRAFT_610745 [Durotheca rogersii]|uniref:uncharacterized protein n=1 Tax=Durotheca rogersii TaxID=419775 RepID=UPI0022204CB1|nr:uncharacterized protein GGS23DRAFT_610745 [Durotheca rogersii]KAI5862101.1 hypothetical protein GGS23DRAFT_610745 [Durotheca rogersii]